MKKLPFYRKDDFIGWLSQEGNTLSFEYAPDWAGEPVSPLLPVNGDFTPEDVRAWFGELLPGERRRHAFEKLRKLSLSRIAEFLAWHGEDLPGDLSTSPALSPEPPRDITKFVAMLIEFGESLDRAAFKFSLAGGEPKIAVILGEGGRFYAPQAGNASTHIIKASALLGPMEDHSSALARNLGLFPVSEISPIVIGDQPFLLMRRFDREKSADGRIERLAQEDFCQACGNPVKYESDGGVSMASMAKVMRKRLDEADRMNFAAMTFFNMIIGNGDDHAGNFAMIRKGREWRLAPAYDLISAHAVRDMALAGNPVIPFDFAEIDINHARKFGSVNDPFRITRKDMASFAALLDVPLSRLRSLAKRMLDMIPAALAITHVSQERAWEGLDISGARKDFALESLNAFIRVVKERRETLVPVFKKAFGQEKRIFPKP